MLITVLAGAALVPERERQAAVMVGLLPMLGLAASFVLGIFAAFAGRGASLRRRFLVPLAISAVPALALALLLAPAYLAAFREPTP